MITAVFVFGMLLLGAGVGVVSGALGLGGGILMVPAFLTFVPGMDPHTATGTSLFIIVFVAALNAWRLIRINKDPQWRLCATLASGSIAGGFAGAWLLSKFPGEVVIWVFVVLLLALAVRTFLIQSESTRKSAVERRDAMAAAIGGAAGFIGGATGTGGGIVLIPLSLMAGIVTNERAVAVSNTVMVATAIAGTVANLTAKSESTLPYSVGNVNLALVPFVFLGTQLVAPFATRFQHHISLRQRKIIMGCILMLITARLIVHAIS